VPLYVDGMTPASLTSRALPAPVSALWAAATWRATANALAGLLAALAGVLVLGPLVILWGAAIISLVATWPAGGPTHAALYIVVVIVFPVLTPWVAQGPTALQRSRLRATLGTQIPPPRIAGRAPWPVGPWLLPGTWRQLGFHVLAVVTGVGGGSLVAACWLAPVAAVGYLTVFGGMLALGLVACAAAVALLLAAPWMARRVTWADSFLARRLLGPSRSEELALRVESLARSRADAVAAADAERRRIERDLHDGAQQRLVSLAMNLGMARERFEGEAEPVREAIAAAHEEAIVALSELREFIRGLHPAVLSDRGLNTALSGLVARAPLPVRLRVDAPRPAAPAIEAVAYFIVSEALTNVVKHAKATSAEVTVTRAGDLLRIVVSDDGTGGAVSGGPAKGSAAKDSGTKGGTGLLGLSQRAAAVDGTLTIDSPPGGPTIITAELPCEL
jgi:signal transduction histidine kinase